MLELNQRSVDIKQSTCVILFPFVATFIAKILSFAVRKNDLLLA